MYLQALPAYPKGRYVHGAALGKWDDTIAHKIVETMVTQLGWDHQRRLTRVVKDKYSFKGVQQANSFTIYSHADRSTGNRQKWTVLSINPVIETATGKNTLAVTVHTCQSQIVRTWVMLVFSRHALARILQRKTGSADAAALTIDVGQIATAAVSDLLTRGDYEAACTDRLPESDEPFKLKTELGTLVLKRVNGLFLVLTYYAND
jgi:hypothetical protein